MAVHRRALGREPGSGYGTEPCQLSQGRHWLPLWTAILSLLAVPSTRRYDSARTRTTGGTRISRWPTTERDLGGMERLDATDSCQTNHRGGWRGSSPRSSAADLEDKQHARLISVGLCSSRMPETGPAQPWRRVGGEVPVPAYQPVGSSPPPSEPACQVTIAGRPLGWVSGSEGAVAKRGKCIV